MSEKAFSFGKNWCHFIKSLNKDRFDFAEKSLTDFMKISDLKGKSFLDIGCGSGLFSFTAQRLGAKKVISFDVDKFSVKCCNHMHELAGRPNNWKIFEGSILDDNTVKKLGKFDIVYSWGVLHHTGNMLDAIKNSAKCVKVGGYYYIAIYNKVGGLKGSYIWLKIKKFYNASPKLVKYMIETAYIAAYMIAYSFKLKNPVSHVRNYHKTKRGMNFRTDVIDWLGGYPYEFATVEEMRNIMKDYFPYFELLNVKRVKGLGNNWFLFRKKR
ncbi:MAG: class I SAM-dependent methyltransferase [Nanoarchaeota archaeon]|nr:class I SAM-dependent methyltransferase [Nanoarchaeota archaeon]MBU1135685.1 class I SAM-dependent methyltransferase [Nanoarchaeota archaeon]MBU2520559.1 class I SAM-dependent methyltransferase [Nanoarchaeota archaeon]